MHANISARFPTVASNWYEKYRAVLRDDVGGIDKVIRAIRYLRDKATTEPEVLRRELGFFRKHRRRLRKPQGQRLRTPVSSANKVLAAHETGALEHEVRMSSRSER